MILDLNRDEVPHFAAHVTAEEAADSPASKAAEDAERAWLAERGLTPVYIPYDGRSTNLSEMLELLKHTARDAAVILGCNSHGINHSVVVYRGLTFNPNTGSIDGPMNDGHWWVTIYAQSTKPLPPELEPASVVIQESDSAT